MLISLVQHATMIDIILHLHACHPDSGQVVASNPLKWHSLSNNKHRTSARACGFCYNRPNPFPGWMS